MKRVEKGTRLHREGKLCMPLKLGPIACLTLRSGESQEVALDWEGFPQYPMKVALRNVGCPPGWTCTGGTQLVRDASIAPAIRLSCENTGSAPIRWETQMIDDDGVRTEAVQHKVQCLRRSRPAA